MVVKLSGKARQKALAEMKGWTKVKGGRDALEKTFPFKDCQFWLMSCRARSRKADHHPEWFNVYNRVHVVLISHDANGRSAMSRLQN